MLGGNCDRSMFLPWKTELSNRFFGGGRYKMRPETGFSASVSHDKRIHVFRLGSSVRSTGFFHVFFEVSPCRGVAGS